MKYTVQTLAKEIKEAVDWLIQEDCGCCMIKLDSVLGICIGWSAGFDENDETVIHSKGDPTYAICVGIKAWTSDDLGTDFDYFNSPYYDDDCSVLDFDLSVRPDEKYSVSNAQYLLECYESIAALDMDYTGKIID